MPSSVGPNTPGTASVDSTATGHGTVNWANVGNISVQDGTSATCILTIGNTSFYLVATNFAFALSASASVVGISCDVRRKASNFTNSINDLHMFLVIGGAVQTGATDKASASKWPNALAAVTYGSNSDMWGTTPTVAQINNSTFGVAIDVTCANNNDTANIDVITMTVYYNLLGLPGTYAMVREIHLPSQYDE